MTAASPARKPCYAGSIRSAAPFRLRIVGDGPLRGAYLVNGLAHCSACHVPRNALGGSSDMLSLAGGLMAAQGWYAPSLLDLIEGSS